MRSNGASNILITRINQDAADYHASSGIHLDYRPIPRLAIALPDHAIPKVCNIVVASAGTSDMSVCEEAALTDEVLASARVIIVVAGMEGALASVLGGLVDCPVIAVPTSFGYGANFGGLSALLGMLNSCASGVSVVNIDNGLGAGLLTGRINKMEGIK